MPTALSAWLGAARAGADAAAASRAAAVAVRDAGGDGWAVVAQAGRLARCAAGVAERDLGLTAALRPVSPDHAQAVAQVSRGAPYPVPDRRGRRARGAWDTPPSLARAVVAAAISASDAPPTAGRDPACGTGAFLVALGEAGVERIEGGDLDGRALAVAAIAAPGAHLSLRSGFDPAPPVPVVVGNPPFVSPEHQDKALRAHLRARFPWLDRRFDLSVPFAAAALEGVQTRGGLGLVLPDAVLTQPYGQALRRRWLAAHRLTWLRPAHAFPGVAVQVVGLALRRDGDPGPLPPHGLDPAALLRLPRAPLGDLLRPGDVALVERVAAASVPLGELCEIDTGVVSHGPLGGKARLLHDAPGPGRVPYVDARDLAQGRLRWLRYDPPSMHRAKRPGLFECDKLLVQRLRGRGPVRAWIDHDGRYAGHTLTVVRPLDGCPVPLERLHALLTSPLVDGLTRLSRGQGLDLYPHDVAAIPVPRAWLTHPQLDLPEALGLSSADAARLAAAAPDPAHR